MIKKAYNHNKNDTMVIIRESRTNKEVKFNSENDLHNVWLLISRSPLKYYLVSIDTDAGLVKEQVASNQPLLIPHEVNVVELEHPLYGSIIWKKNNSVKFNHLLNYETRVFPEKSNNIQIGTFINQVEYDIIGGIWTDQHGKINYVGMIKLDDGSTTVAFPKMSKVYIADVALIGIKHNLS